MALRSLINATSMLYLKNTSSNTLAAVTSSPWISSSQVRFAKRRGIRMQAEQAKKKKLQGQGPKKTVEKKFIPYKLLAKRSSISRRYDVDNWLKMPPVDDVWLMRHYKIRQYTTTDAIDLIRQTHHPTVYDKPDALIYLTVELDMRLAKKNKFLDNFSNIVYLPHVYEGAPSNKVIVVTQSEDDHVASMQNGAVAAGYKDVINSLKTGELTTDDYDYVLATPDIVKEMLPLKGILKNKFPSTRNKTALLDVTGSVERFTKGFPFACKTDNFEHDFGWIDITCGQLTMTNNEIYENVDAIIKTIMEYKPPGIQWPFITRINLTSPPSAEKFDLQISDFIAPEPAEEQQQSIATN